jgi:hypothetical protein
MPNHLLMQFPAGIGDFPASAVGGPERGGDLARALQFDKKLGDLLGRASRSAAGALLWSSCRTRFRLYSRISYLAKRRTSCWAVSSLSDFLIGLGAPVAVSWSQ